MDSIFSSSQTSVKPLQLSLANSLTKVFQLSSEFEWIYRQENLVTKQKVSESFPDSYFLFYQVGGQSAVRFRTPNGICRLEPGKALLLPPFTLIHWEIDPGELVWYAYRVHKSYPENWPQKALIIEAPLNQLFGSELELYAWVDLHLKSSVLVESELNNSYLAQTTKRYIDQLFRDDLGLDDLAVHLKTTSASISHTFSRCYSLSPIEYRNRLRLQYAIIQMAVKNKCTTDSCYEAGFQDFSRFYRNFKTYIGAKPSQFLKKNLKSHSS